MVIDRDKIQEYPFLGHFYSVGYNADLDQDVEELLLTTECDIQRTQISDSGGTLISSYTVYFSFDKEVGIPIKRGMKFISNMYGLDIQGLINEPFATQLGGCEVTLKDIYV